ncbi:MAG: membrane protein insertion efficiency factor YidD [Helicobacteraceae bacterium]|nr:membrane protein insertion efficiency factor YidD [Helicobacteraceae bacterium]
MNLSIANRIFIALIRVYQRILSPFVGRWCRFYPSCSNYALWLFATTPFFYAIKESAKRILRCQPLFCGGVDYPPIPFTPPVYSSIFRDKINKKKAIDRIIWYIIPLDGKFIVIRRQNANARRVYGSRL